MKQMIRIVFGVSVAWLLTGGAGQTLGAPAFPSSIAGLRLRLEVDSGVQTSGSAVTNWIDQSGNGFNASQGTAANQPLYVAGASANGLYGAIRFDGVRSAANGDSLSHATAAMPPTNLTTFIVYVPQVNTGGAGGEQMPFYWGGPNSGGKMRCVYLVNGTNGATYPISAGFIGYGADTGAGKFTVASNTQYLSTFQIGSLTALKEFNRKTGDGSSTSYYDTSSYSPAFGTPTTAGYTIGGTPCPTVPNYSYKGDILAILVYSNALSDTDRQTVDQYLYDKYFALPGPSIQNQPASAVTTNSATFNGWLINTNGSATTVYVLWGTNNGAVSGAWANTNWWNPGDWTNNSFPSTNIALTANQDYFYTFCATNLSGITTASPPQYLTTGPLTIQATDPTGRSNLSDTITFTVSRPTNCTNGSLTVYYTMTGTASNGVDYTISPASGSLTLLAGQTSTNITVTPAYMTDPSQTVIVTLTAGPYAIGSTSADTGTLAAISLAQWWDAGAGAGLDSGNATWSTSANAWALTAAGTNAPGPWFNNSIAAFAAAGTSTVNVQNVSAAGMTITAGTNIFQPGPGSLTNGSLGIASTVSATFNNDIALSANQTWNNSAGTLTVTGLISGANIALTKSGAGTLTLSNAASSLSGGLTVKNGNVNAYGQSTGTVLGNGPMTLGTVVPSDGSAFSVATVTLANGGAGNYTNTVGNLTSSGGAAVLALNSAANTTNTLIVGNLTRTAPGTLVLSPQNSLAVRENVQLTGTVSLVNGIVPPWAVNSLNNGDYVTTNSAGALTNVVYAGGFNAGLNNKVVTNGTATNLTGGAQAYYAAKLTANLNLNGNTLTMGDGTFGGLILGSGVAITNSTGSPNLAFGAAEALLYVGAANTATIATPMTGTGNLTKFGGGTLVISNTAAVWPSSGAINLNGGALTLWANQDKTATNWINGPGAFTKDGPNTLTLSGTNAINGTLTANGGGTLNIGTSGGNDLLLSGGGIVGNGSANSTLNLASNATWNLFGQSVTVGSGTAAGNVLTINSGVLTNGGVIVGGSSGSISNGLVVANGNQFMGNINVTLGNIAGANSNYYNIGGGVNPVTVSNGLITVGSAGAWNRMTVTNANLWSTGLNIGGGNSNTVTVLTNSTWNLLGGNIGMGGISNQMVISGGTVTNVGTVNVGSTATGNLYNDLTVKNGGSLFASTLTLDPYGGSGSGGFNTANLGGAGAPSIVNVTGSIYINAQAGYGKNSTLTISNAYVTCGSTLYIAGKGGYNEAVYVLQGGTLNVGAGVSIASGGSGGQHDNTLVINGGVVTGAASTVSIGADISGPYRNSTIITNGGQLYNQAITLGAQSPAYSNTFTVTGVGSLCNTMGKTLTAGGAANTTGNVASVLSGAILDVAGLVTGAGPGNLITNSGSVYQFNIATPTITVGAGSAGIAINNGVTSFRGVNGVNVKGNWPGNGSQLANMTFYGTNNAFRLNNSTNLANTATNQTYWFDAIAGSSTNYAGLEMISDAVGGGTAYTNGSVTIGTNGWLTYSNTTAIMWGAVTNYGRMTFYNSTVTFMTNLWLGNNGTLIWTSNSLITVNGTLTLPTSMTFSNASSSTPSDNWLVLTNTSGTIIGTPSGWTVYPGNHRLTKVGNTLSYVPRLPGFLFIVE